MAKVVFTFRGNLDQPTMASVQQRVETAVRALGLPEVCEVKARLQADGAGQIEVTNVPADFEEQVRTTVSGELVASHEAVIQEE